MDNILENIFKFVINLEIKNKIEADRYDSLDQLKSSKDFIAAYYKLDNFLSYTFSDDDYLEINHDPNLYRNKLPDIDIQEKLLDNKRNMIINSYQETNNYYRRLNGLPNYDDSPLFIENKSVLDFDNNDLIKYKSIIDEYIQKDIIKYGYLKYLVNNKIPFYISRYIKHFDIITFKPFILSENYEKKFIELYYESISYVKATIYKPHLCDDKYYDNFIILFTVFITIGKFINSLVEFNMRKDFFNKDIVKTMFLSYGLPFYDDIPLKFLTKLIKNLNHILQTKGTDKCLIDIIELFGFTDIEVFKYYLTKGYGQDSEGNINPDSKELFFIQVPSDVSDINKYTTKSYLYKSYEDVVSEDPFWGNNFNNTGIDEDFKKELLDLEFNYLNTKYISINTIFNITKVNFEINYFFNLLNTFHHNRMIDNIYFTSNQIKESLNTIKLYDIIIAINILLYKRFGFNDNIIYNPQRIGAVYGFSFNQNYDILKEILKEALQQDKISGQNIPYNNTYDNLIKTLSLDTKQENKEYIIRLFFESKALKDNIEKMMVSTNSYQKYKLLESVYKFNMYADSMYYNMGSDSYSTYSEYLIDNDLELYEFTQKDTETTESIIKKLDILLNALEGFFNSDKFDFLFNNIPSVSAELIKDYMKKALMMFKAYTVDLRDINIYYIFDDKYLNGLRFFEYLHSQISDMKGDSLINQIQDIMFYQDLLSKEVSLKLNNIIDVSIKSKIMQDKELLAIYEKHSESYKMIGHNISFDHNIYLTAELKNIRNDNVMKHILIKTYN